MSTPNRIPTEHEEQRELVRWFRQTWPCVRIHAIPNGGARNKATAGRLAEDAKAKIRAFFDQHIKQGAADRD